MARDSGTAPGQIEAARGLRHESLADTATGDFAGHAALCLARPVQSLACCHKDTALLAVVGFNELVLETRQAAGTTKAYFTFFMAAGALYLAITLFSNFILARIEKSRARGLPKVA